MTASNIYNFYDIHDEYNVFKICNREKNKLLARLILIFIHSGNSIRFQHSHQLSLGLLKVHSYLILNNNVYQPVRLWHTNIWIQWQISEYSIRNVCQSAKKCQKVYGM